MKIIAYAYSADIHCIDCTKHNYRQAIDAIEYVSMPEDYSDYLDENGVPLKAIDECGLINPIFSTDEQLEPLVCGDCHKVI